MNRLQLLHHSDASAGARRSASRCLLASMALAAALTLPTPQVYAQASAAATTQQVPALLGGKVEALVANTTGDTLAVAIEGAGVYVGTFSSAGMNWTAQTFPAGTNPSPYVSDLTWDGAGELWAAAGGYGLWKRSAAGVWSQVRGVGGEVALSAARGEAGRVMVGTFQGVFQVAANGADWVQIAPYARRLRAPLHYQSGNSAATLAGLGVDEVYLLKNKMWEATRVPATPYRIAFDQGGVLHAATKDGVQKLVGNTWQSLGPNRVEVNTLWFDAANKLLNNLRR